MTVSTKDEPPGPKTKKFQSLIQRIKQGGIRSLPGGDQVLINEISRLRYVSTNPAEVEKLKDCLLAIHIATLEHTLTLTAER